MTHANQISPPPSSLRRVFSRYRLLVLLLSIAGGVVAFGLSRAQETVYEATSSISVRDVNTDLSLVGISSASSLSPAQLASASAQAVTRIDTLEQVRRPLGTRISALELRRNVTATVDSETNLIEVRARSGTASFAAELANALARTAVKTANENVRSRYRRAAEDLRGRLRVLKAGRANETTRIVLAEQASRLQTVSIVAEPASIVDLARPASSPASPKPLFNTVLGSVFGLMMGVGAALLLLALDGRMHTQADIANESDLPLLATVRDSVMGSLPFNVDKPNDEQHAAIDGFGILRRKLELTDLEQSPRIIAVTSGGPEEGKSTVAAAVAAAFAVVGCRTLLLECDLRRPALMSRYGAQATPGLAEFLEGQAEPEEILRVLPLPYGSSNGSESTLVCVPAGTPTVSADDLLASSRFEEFLKEVSQVYDKVVIDTPPLLPVADTLEILPMVDTYILCVRAARTTRMQFAETLRTTRAVPVAAAGIVATGVSENDQSQLGYAYGYRAGALAAAR